MSIKLYERDPIIKNVIFFVIFSIPYYYVIFCLNKGISAVDYNKFYDFFSSSLEFLVFGFLTVYLVYRVKKSSFYFFIGFCGFIFIKCFLIYLQDFNKIVLLLSFLYLILFYYLQIYWKMELTDVIYSSFVEKRIMAPLDIYKIKATLQFPNGASRDGILSNWDENGCFLKFFGKIPMVSKEVEIFLTFAERDFKQKGIIVSREGDGFGIKFILLDRSYLENKFLGWKDFYDISSDRGIYPVHY